MKGKHNLPAWLAAAIRSKFLEFFEQEPVCWILAGRPTPDVIDYRRGQILVEAYGIAAGFGKNRARRIKRWLARVLSSFPSEQST